MVQKTTLFFDFNGTILNDLPAWEKSVKKVFNNYGKEPPTIEEYFTLMKKDYLEAYRSKGITASREEINDIYIPEYNRLVHTAEMFPGVLNTLLFLKKKGIKLGLLTLQPEEMVQPLLKKFFIESVFLPDYTEFHCKDKAKAIVKIAETTGTDLECICFMGDTPSDISQGQEAGVRTAAFLPGHLPQSMFEENPPNYLFTNFNQAMRFAG